MAINNKVFIFDVTKLKNETLFSKFYNLMPEYRKNKIDCLVQEKDKILSLGAGILFRDAMLSIGIEEDPEIIYENGKPMLRDYSDIFFNISHSGNKVVLVISSNEVGCDIERIKSERKSIVDRCYTKSEQLYVNKFDGRARDFAFYKIWTLKESFIKNIGAGLRIPLTSFSITLGEKIGVTQNIAKDDFSFLSMTTDDDYQIAICFSNCSNSDKVEFNRFEL